ncbi:MAG TPA: hypothetical protein PKZ53_03115 [Acidobacteriota bacterium]|nr:hypothetical protein [Acidobacteriota bacterium]
MFKWLAKFFTNEDSRSPEDSISIYKNESQVQQPVPRSYTLICSSCYSRCSGSNAHVIPWWNPDQKNIFTTYRCGNCWLSSLEETRQAVLNGGSEVQICFCDFLTRQGLKHEARTIRDSPPEQSQALLLAILTDVQEQKVIFHP